MSNSVNNKIGYIEIPTDNIEETKKFYSNMFGWEYEKSEEGGGGENYWLIKKCGNKRSNNFKKRR